jgi:hypothetical protein
MSACREKQFVHPGTTIGRVTGLESIIRHHDYYYIEHTSIEIAFLPYDQSDGRFWDDGDPGSTAPARDGRIVRILAGLSGSTDETYITDSPPFWWIKQKIKPKFPDCFLYEVVN